LQARQSWPRRSLVGLFWGYGRVFERHAGQFSHPQNWLKKFLTHKVNILPILELGVRLDAVVALGRLEVELVAGDLVGEVEDGVLLVVEHEVVVLHLHLRDFLGDAAVVLLKPLPPQVK